MSSINRYSNRKGYFPIEQALFCHIIWLKPQNVRNAQAFQHTKQSNGRVLYYGMFGNSKGIADAHTLLKIKDKAQPFTEKQLLDLPNLIKSEVSMIVKDYIKRLYKSYLVGGANAQAIGIDIFELTEDKSLETAIPVAKFWNTAYQMGSPYHTDGYWYIRNPFEEFYQELANTPKPQTLQNLINPLNPQTATISRPTQAEAPIEKDYSQNLSAHATSMASKMKGGVK